LLLHPEGMDWLQSDVVASPWPAATPPQSDKLDATVLEVMRQTPPVGGFFRRSLQAIELADVAVPENSVIQVALTPTAATDGTDLSAFRPQRHLDGSFEQTLLPFGGGERVCLGKALAELEIRLMAVGLLQKVQLQLVPDQDLALQLVPSPTPRSGLMVTASGH
jgi:cytochrome P450